MMLTETTMRACGPADAPAMLRIINAAAEAYHGVIPADRWHDPYMPAEELAREMAAGVRFTGAEAGAELVGVMGVQSVRNVTLVRHAYVSPGWQGRGTGAALLTGLRVHDAGVLLVGTWRPADWAMRFYERHGFAQVPDEATAPLLRTYWTIPDRQIETSVVLAMPALSVAAAARLMAEA